MSWSAAFIAGICMFIALFIMAVIIFCIRTFSDCAIVAQVTQVLFFVGWLGMFIVLWIGIAYIRSADFCYEDKTTIRNTIMAIIAIAVIAMVGLIVLAAHKIVVVAVIVCILSTLALSICFVIFASAQVDRQWHCQDYEKGMDFLDLWIGFSLAFVSTVIFAVFLCSAFCRWCCRCERVGVGENEGANVSENVGESENQSLMSYYTEENRGTDERQEWEG
jgi:hypothetical protein